MVKDESAEGNARYEGFIPDLLEKLQTKIPDFNYELSLVQDGSYGTIKNGKWTGMIGEVKDEVIKE